MLCQMLKRTFDPVPDLRRPMWNPTPGSNGADAMGLDEPASSRIGPQGVSPDVVHTLRRRAGAMEALAYIGQVDDGFRKTMIDQGIVACMVDSLTAYGDAIDVDTLTSADALDGKKGNPLVVLIAACKLARALSRSVNILRTSLIDGGLAKPILQLLSYPNMDVKRQATNVTCNLLLQFSPMRDVSRPVFNFCLDFPLTSVRL
jgi:armadillo repeat-containing protein 8